MFFASGLIEAVLGYKKMITYLSHHIPHAGSSKKSAVYKQTLIICNITLIFNQIIQGQKKVRDNPQKDNYMKLNG